MAAKRGMALARVPEGRAVYSVAVSSAGFVRWAAWESASAAARRLAPTAHGQAATTDEAVRAVQAVTTEAVKIASWWASPAGLSSCRRTKDDDAMESDLRVLRGTVESAVLEIGSMRWLARRYADAFAAPGAEDQYLGVLFAMSNYAEPSDKVTLMKDQIINRMTARHRACRGQA